MKSKKNGTLVMALCIFMIVLLTSVSLNLAQSHKLNRQERQMRQLVSDYQELDDQYLRMDSIVSSMDSIICILLDKVAEQHAQTFEKK